MKPMIRKIQRIQITQMCPSMMIHLQQSAALKTDFFQFLEEDNTYSACEECVVVNADGQCQVRDCDNLNEYQFLQPDGTYGSCATCEELDPVTGECIRRIVEPEAPTPAPPSDDDSNSDDDDSNRRWDRRERRESGGDGDGDPLMIDTLPKKYANIDSFSDVWFDEHAMTGFTHDVS